MEYTIESIVIAFLCQTRHVLSAPIINLDPELYSIFLSASMDFTSVSDTCGSNPAQTLSLKPSGAK